MPMAKNLVELRDVYKIYGEGRESEVRALDGVSLTMLGIIIGIAAVMTIVSAINGYTEKTMEQ